MSKTKKITKFVFGANDNVDHVAITHKLQGYSANNRPDPLLIKANDVQVPEEVLALVKSIEKKTEGEPSGSNDEPTKTVPQVTEKSTGDKMDKVEIEKSQLELLTKAAEMLEEMKKQKETLEVALEKANKEKQEQLIKSKVEIVKGLGFVSDEAKQVAVATALIKTAGVDLEGAKAIEEALQMAKAAVEAAVTKEVGSAEGKEVDGTIEAVMKAVKQFKN